MAISYPTSLDTLTNPSGSDTTSGVDHASQHSNANDAIEALEAKVGVTNSAVTSSIEYKLTNASSSNPGHKHTLAQGATDVTATVTEVNYLSGVTSAVQTQLGTKAASGANSDITSLAGLTTPLTVAQGGSGRASHTAYAVLCGGTTTTAAQQSVASVGTSGQVLTSNGASNLPTFQTLITGADFVFDWSNAVLPDSNFPSIGKTVGTNWVYKTLDFDQTTSESCYWYFVIPSNFSTITSATMKIQWTAASGTGTFISSVITRSPSNDEVIDATTTPSSAAAVTVEDTLIATGDLHQASLALTTTGWAAGDVIQVKFSRDISDTLNADAKVQLVLLELR